MRNCPRILGGCWVALVALVGCRTIALLPEAALGKLSASQETFLSGAVSGWGRKAVLEDRDFVYAVALDGAGKRAAVTHLDGKRYLLAVWALESLPRRLFEAEINPYEYDVEAVAFTPNGSQVVTVSREKTVRLFDSSSGKLLQTFKGEEPLVSLAVHPSGEWLAVGSSKGRVMVLSLPKLRFLTELRPLENEVRGLAFADDGTLYAGGWDKAIVRLRPAMSAAATTVRVGLERKGISAVVRGELNRRTSVRWAIDARVDHVLMRSAVAAAAGIPPAAMMGIATLSTPLGSTLAPMALGQRLDFKSLGVPDLDIAVCDLCVPEGVDGVLGAPFTSRYSVVLDEHAQEVELGRKQGPALEPTLGLSVEQRWTFPWFVNDVTVDRRGEVLGVAFSEAPAERTRQVYLAEKEGKVEPEKEGNCGARVDAKDGRVLEKVRGHHGVVATAAISPDGTALATGGWDHHLLLQQSGVTVADDKFGWSVRRARFSRDGRFVIVGAWTPQNSTGDQRSAPSALVEELEYRAPEVVSGGRSAAKRSLPR